jgi:hypothetical protein
MSNEMKFNINDEQIMFWKGVIVAYFNTSSRYLLVGLRKIRKSPVLFSGRRLAIMMLG